MIILFFIMPSSYLCDTLNSKTAVAFLISVSLDFAEIGVGSGVSNIYCLSSYTTNFAISNAAI